MSYIIINSTKKNIDWKWDENSILNHISSDHDPKDIFDAVCAEIKHYYTGKESYKTLKKKVKWKGKYLNAEMAFWSSHSNLAGEFVNFEIVTSGYSNDSKGMENKGLLYLGIRPANYDIHDIDYDLFREIIGYIDACVDFFKTIDSYEGFKKLINEQDFAFKDAVSEGNRQLFLEKITL
ncbi:hypothetical protein [Butyrivibrio proteoclasticus]|uniref:hypothetical protein n=1 Tax=Butyrivibrio proteoclasticus TaxID=43305 RepID=UPI00047B8EEA|nr:hypothetical protein [Butyrivibrio proteoclasticus]